MSESNEYDPSSIPPQAGYDTLGQYAAEVARLAELPPHEYDRARKSEAKRLEVRLETLDSDVKKARPREAADDGQGEAIVLDDPEPWPERVDGAVLLDDLRAFFEAHLALPPHAAVKLALWTLHTFAFEAFFISPRLAITSATRRCGKTTLVDILAVLCSRSVTADSLTAAATFRTISIAQPTLLIDEADTFLRDNEELRGILNSGHKSTGSVIRAVESNGEWVPRRFRTFSPCAIAMIGRLPSTLEDRSIQAPMKRAVKGEVLRCFRPDRKEIPHQLRRKAARFAADNMAALIAAEPELPSGAFNRFADNWRPLAALAAVAGGKWPERVRAAILSDLDEAEEDEQGQQLLEDIKSIFDSLVDPEKRTVPAQKLASHIIVQALKEMADRPWNELGRNEVPITQNKLAKMLKPFGIKSHGTVRFADGKTAKGYLRSAFEEAWNRYLSPKNFSSPPDSQNRTVTPSQATDCATLNDFATVTKGPFVTVAKAPKAMDSAGCDGVTDANRGSAGGEKKSSANGAGDDPICAHCECYILPDSGGYTATHSGEVLHNTCVDAWSRERPPAT
jgi:Protein of unknown function (DUF3631)